MGIWAIYLGSFRTSGVYLAVLKDLKFLRRINDESVWGFGAGSLIEDEHPLLHLGQFQTISFPVDAKLYGLVYSMN